jgi:AAA15 family ATPase/GTPase
MEEENVLRKETIEMEKAKGFEMRERALECFGETRKRVLEQMGKGKQPAKKRRKSGEMFEWLNKRVEVDMENKEKERRERQEEREIQQQQSKQLIELMVNSQEQYQENLRVSTEHWQQPLHHQQQQQQQQQQFSMLQHQMMAMMQQSQQQTQAMFELLLKDRE